MTYTTPSTISTWSPGRPMQRLMKSGLPSSGQRRAKDDDLLALRLAPERHVDIGEGHAGVVAEAAHDQVIADEQRVFHRAAGNHAGLHHGSGDQQERDDHPEPGNDFAPDALVGGGLNRLALFDRAAIPPSQLSR